MQLSLFPTNEYYIAKQPSHTPRFRWVDGDLCSWGKKLKFFKSSSRTVYTDGKRVYKVSSPNINSVNQSLAEWEKWQEIDKRDRQYFARCYNYYNVDDYSIIIQKLYQPDGNIDNKIWRDANTLAYKLARMYQIDDLENKNYFIVNGKLLIYDFGYLSDSERYMY